MRDHCTNHFHYKMNGIHCSRGESNKGPSMTVPDQTLSLKELLARYVRNPDSVAVYEPVYVGDDPDIPDNLERMTQIDRIEAAKQIKLAIHNKQMDIEIAIASAKKEKAVPVPETTSVNPDTEM